MALPTKFIAKFKSAISCITLVVQILHLFAPFILVSSVRAQETISPTEIISIQPTPSSDPSPTKEISDPSSTPSASPTNSQKIFINPSPTSLPTQTPTSTEEVAPSIAPDTSPTITIAPSPTPTQKKTNKFSIPSLKVQFTRKEGKKFVYVTPAPEDNELIQYRDTNRKVFKATQKEALENISPSDQKSKISKTNKEYFRTVIYSGPIMSKVEGTYQPIDNTLVVDETDIYKYKNTNAPFVFRAGESLASGVSYIDEKGKVCNFTLSSLDGKSATDVKGVISENILTYKGIKPGIDLQFTISNTGVKTEVVVAPGTTPPSQYDFALFDCAKASEFFPATATRGNETKSLEVNLATLSAHFVTKEDGFLWDKTVSDEQKEISVLSVNMQEDQFPVSDQELRVDPSLGGWMNTTFVAKDVTTSLYALSDYALGSINSYTDARSFMWFNRDSIPYGATVDVVGGYLSLSRTQSNKDAVIEVYNTKIGDGVNTNVQTNVNNFVTNARYPGVGSILPNLITIGSDGVKTSTPAEIVGVPRLIGGSQVGTARIHIPAWILKRWRYNASGGWLPDEGLMLKMRNDAGMVFKGAYNNITSQMPSVVVYASTDVKNTNRGQLPTIPKLMMPEPGSYTTPDDGVRCDESVSPASGLCRSNIKLPIVVDAGDPDGWGDGDILGVSFSLRGDTVNGVAGGTSATGFVNGTSPGITYLADLKDGLTWWKAQSKDRTNLLSAWSSEFKVYHDTTPPNVPSFASNSASFNTKNISLTSQKTSDNLSLPADIYYQYRYAKKPTSNESPIWYTSALWQRDNVLYQVGSNGADGVSGNADDLTDGDYLFQTKAKDQVGNISAWSNSAEISIDSAPPALSDYVASSRVGLKKTGIYSVNYSDSAPVQAMMSIKKTGSNAYVYPTSSIPSTTPTPTPTSAPLVPPATFNLKSQGLGGNSFYLHTSNIGGVNRLWGLQYTNNLAFELNRETGLLVKYYAIGNGSQGTATAIGSNDKYIFVGTSLGFISVIDPLSQTVVKTVQVTTGQIWDIVSAGGNIWISHFSQGTVKKLDSTSLATLCSATTNTTSASYGISKLLPDGGGVIGSHYGNGLVYRINDQCAVTKTSSYMSSPYSMVKIGDKIYIPNYSGHSITILNFSDLAIVATKPINITYPSTVTTDGSKLYISNAPNGTAGNISVYNPADFSLSMTKVISGEGRNYGATYDGKYIWISHFNTSTVSRFDPRYPSLTAVTLPTSTPTIAPSMTATPTPTPDMNFVRNFTKDLTGTTSGNVSFDWDGTDPAGKKLSDGTYSVLLEIKDKSGNVSKTTEKIVIVDNTAANVIMSAPFGGYITSSDTFDLKGQIGVPHISGLEDADVATCEIKASGSAIWSSFDCDTIANIFHASTSLGEGINVVNIRTTDETNNQLEVSTNIIKDTASPTLSILTPSGLSKNARPKVSFNTTDEHSFIPLGANPKGMKIALTYPIVNSSGTTETKSKILIENGVTLDKSLTSDLVCTATDATLTKNDLNSSKSAYCEMNFLAPLSPDNDFTFSVITADTAGNTTSSSTTQQLDTTTYLRVLAPVAGTTYVSSKVPLRLSIEKDTNLALNGKSYFVDETLNGTGSDDINDPEKLIASPFQVSCTSSIDHDENSTTPALAVCEILTEIYSDFAINGSDTSNSLDIRATDSLGNTLLDTRTFNVNPTLFGASISPDTQYFSPNGDGVGDGVNFATDVFASSSQGTPTIVSYELVIKQIKDAAGTSITPQIVRTIKGDNLPPSPLVWDGRTDGFIGDLIPGNYVTEGTYSYQITITSSDGVSKIAVPANNVPQFLIAKKSLNDTVLITSPVEDTIFSSESITVTGYGPRSEGLLGELLSISDSLKGRVQTRVCVEDSINSFSKNCNTVTNSSSGAFASPLLLPLTDSSIQKAVFHLTATSFDSYGNSIQTSPPVTIVYDKKTALIGINISPKLVGASNQTTYNEYLAKTKNIKDVRSVLVSVNVENGTDAIEVSYADFVNLTPTASPTPTTPTPTPSGQYVTSFTLINVDTNTPIEGYDPIVQGSTINLAKLPTKNINIRANTYPATVGSVRFALDTNTNYRSENSAPYALGSDSSGIYAPWSYTLGTHTVKATPYSERGITGTTGTPLTLDLTLIDDATLTATPTPTPLPTVQVKINTYLGLFDDTKENDPIQNPENLEIVKKNLGVPTPKNLNDVLASNPGKCVQANGCNWNFYLPIKPTMGGIYDMTIKSKKGDQVSQAMSSFQVDNTLPTAPTILVFERFDSNTNTYIPMLQKDGKYYANTLKMRLTLAGQPNTYVKLNYILGTDSEKLANFTIDSSGTQVDKVKIPSTGSITLVWDELTLPANSTNNLTLTPSSFELDGSGNVYNEQSSSSRVPAQLILDNIGASISYGFVTSQSPDAVGSYTASGGLVNYIFTTSKDIVKATIMREDGFVANLLSLDTLNFVADITVEKLQESYYNATVFLTDLWGNITSFSALDWFAQKGDLTSDFRVKIDNTPPLVAVQPFILYGAGGKNAGETPATADSVYIGTLNEGFVSRSQTINLKANAEAGSRVQFFANGNPLGELQYVGSENCYIRPSNTPSTTLDESGQPIMMPGEDKVTSDGLITRYAAQCEVSTQYTFAGDGKSSGKGGEPQEGYYFQIQVVDSAGNRSPLSRAVYVYHDTVAPATPSIEVSGDSVWAKVKGERLGDVLIVMTSPSGVETITKTTDISTEGEGLEMLRLTFTDEMGDYTIKAVTYDAAGNSSSWGSATYTRTVPEPDPDLMPAEDYEIQVDENGVTVNGQRATRLSSRPDSLEGKADGVYDVSIDEVVETTNTCPPGTIGSCVSSPENKAIREEIISSLSNLGLGMEQAFKDQTIGLADGYKEVIKSLIRKQIYDSSTRRMIENYAHLHGISYSQAIDELVPNQSIRHWYTFTENDQSNLNSAGFGLGIGVGAGIALYKGAKVLVVGSAVYFIGVSWNIFVNKASLKNAMCGGHDGGTMYCTGYSIGSYAMTLVYTFLSKRVAENVNRGTRVISTTSSIWSNTEIAIEKIRDYLLNPNNPQNSGKAAFFKTVLGYDQSTSLELIENIKSNLHKFPIDQNLTQTTLYGTKYSIPMSIVGLNGKTANIMTIWQIDSGSTILRFITSFPN